MFEKPIWLFRMTHIDNIGHILKYGITHKDSPNRNAEFKTIGNSTLISKRDSWKIKVDNGNIFSENQNEIILGNFIPFYFWVKMPMLFQIQQGDNHAKVSISPDNIVYIICSLEKVAKAIKTFFFTDGHAVDRFTSVYDKSKIEDILSIIDTKAIKADYWGPDENLNTKRKKQAEFLAGEDIPISCIIRFGCYNEQAKAKLIRLGIDESLIGVNPHNYY